MDELSAKKTKKKRGETAYDVLKHSLENVRDDDTVVVVSMRDNEVAFGYSWDSSMMALAMMEVAKQDILDFMRS